MDKHWVKHCVITTLVLLVIVSGLLLASSEQSMSMADVQASIVVDTLEDELNNDGDCSLREAIQAAGDNAVVDACPAGSALPDMITFSVDGMIKVSDSLMINPGNVLVIDGGDTVSLSGNQLIRIFIIYGGADLTLQQISLVDGNDASYGGAVDNRGILTITGSTFSRNHSEDHGGAIYNGGTLQVYDSIFSDNSSSTVIQFDCFYSDATNGGAIYNAKDATLQVDDSQFLRNQATNEGGAIFNAGTAEVRRSTISDGHACLGGGLSNANDLVLSDSVINNNHALDRQGTDVGGAGGGIMDWGNLTMSNSTISGNIGDRGVGGIYAQDFWMAYAITITNSTVFSNTAPADFYDPPGNLEFDRFFSEPVTVTARNSIIAGSPNGINCSFDGTAIIDDGNNIEDANTCGFSPINGSMPDTDPLLEALEDNGGKTLTHALQAGSLAIDGAKPVYCPPVDQRGIDRPYDGDENGEAVCDIGAFELNPNAFQLQRFYLPFLRKN